MMKLDAGFIWGRSIVNRGWFLTLCLLEEERIEIKAEFVRNVRSNAREGKKAKSMHLVFVLFDLEYARIKEATCMGQSMDMQQLREVGRTIMICRMKAHAYTHFRLFGDIE